MINNLILAIITIVLFILIGIIIYFIFDYFSYKNNVNKSIKISTDYANKSVIINNSNIINSTAALESKYDTLISGLTGSINNSTSNYYLTSNSLLDFDNALNNYFSFEEDNSPINKRIYEYNFTGINPNMNLLTQVNAISGMTIDTTNNLLDEKNLRICNKNTSTPGDTTTSNYRSCININLSDTGDFNITPETNNNSLLINGLDDNILAKFDYKTNDIYFGGNGTEDNPGSLRINKENLYIKDINLINGNSKTNIYDDSSTDDFNNNVNAFNYDSLGKLNNINNTLMCYYSIDTSTTPLKLTLNMVSHVPIQEKSSFTIKIPDLTVDTAPNASSNPSGLSIASNSSENNITLTIPDGSTINARNNINIVFDSGLSTASGSANGILMVEIIPSLTVPAPTP